MLPLDASAKQIAAMKERVAELGMSISAHGVNPFGKDAAANRKTFEFAKALGIRNISADPDPESFDSLNDLVQEFDIRIAIHNHGPRHRYNKAVDVLQAIEGRDERIGACADLGHYIRSGEQATDVIRLLKGRLYGIHLKDFAEMKADAKGVVLGQGPLECAGRFRRTREGWISGRRRDVAGIRGESSRPDRRNPRMRRRGQKGSWKTCRKQLHKKFEMKTAKTLRTPRYVAGHCQLILTGTVTSSPLMATTNRVHPERSDLPLAFFSNIRCIEEGDRRRDLPTAN